MKNILTLMVALVSSMSFAQDIKVVNFDQLQEHLTQKTSAVQVVNFWATWCKPCVQELPYFDVLQAMYKTEDVEVILVSMDFPKELENKVKPFIKKRGMKAEVVLLDDLDANVWINKVDPDWSGAIPATLIIRGKQRKFIEGELSQEELNSEVDKIIKLNG